MSKRPDFPEISSRAEFEKWYWRKEELLSICKNAGLSTTGSKIDLKDRIMDELAGRKKSKHQKPAGRSTSKFNWAREELSLETTITDNVKFGPNFRNFMKSQIGSSFSCNSDFMSWVKQNVGKNLEEAVNQWRALEDRKKDPTFRSVIAPHNNYNQYIRDFLDDNSGRTFKEAVKCWNIKKTAPTEAGVVKYQPRDVRFLL